MRAVSSKILVIDDEASIRELLRLMLEMSGFTVVMAANGKDALDLLARSDAPCLILLDLMMPVMNGWEFFRIIRADERYKNIPVVVISAYTSAEMELPAVDVLEKPFEMDLLRGYAERYCRGSGGGA